MIPRRTLLAAGPMALAACGRAEETYFGKTDPPKTQRLVYLLEVEPRSLDPVLALELQESLILSLFEGLTSLHPVTGEPMAALATHYDLTPNGLRYTFYLRGHLQQSGRRLPNTEDLPNEYSRGRMGAPANEPALWSDGVRIDAHDFVYSWRRALDPSTGANFASLLHHIQNAQQITAGKMPSEKLGICALDDFTLQVDLAEPTPFFLELVSGRMFCPVPRHALEAFGSRWTDPCCMVSSGAFILAERHPYDRIVLTKNARYYDAGQVALNHLVFLVVTDPTPRLNLYKAGQASMTQPWIPTIMPTLRRKKDLRLQPTYASEFWAINTTSPPLNDVRLRYALNMAIDKRPIADLAGAGSVPALSPVPPTAGYPGLRTLWVSVDGVTCDVLAFNPQAARQIITKIAHPLPMRLEYLCATMPDSILWAQILRDQWRAHLEVEIVIKDVELKLWVQSVLSGNFRHVAGWGSAAHYVDPAWFLDLFSGGNGYGTGWSDATYNNMLADAHATADPASRIKKLSECERRLLGAMPILPMCHDVQPNLKKPFVRGVGSNLLNRSQMKYAWIDMNWRPQ